MKKFIKINEERITLSSIKKYMPVNDNKLNVYYSVSMYRVELEVFSFDNTDDRDAMVSELDNLFGV